jgi:hypothetical protein
MPRKDHAKGMSIVLGRRRRRGSEQCPAQSSPSPFLLHNESGFDIIMRLTLVEFDHASKAFIYEGAYDPVRICQSGFGVTG